MVTMEEKSSGVNYENRELIFRIPSDLFVEPWGDIGYPRAVGEIYDVEGSSAPLMSVRTIDRAYVRSIMFLHRELLERRARSKRFQVRVVFQRETEHGTELEARIVNNKYKGWFVRLILYPESINGRVGKCTRCDASGVLHRFGSIDPGFRCFECGSADIQYKY